MVLSFYKQGIFEMHVSVRIHDKITAMQVEEPTGQTVLGLLFIAWTVEEICAAP